MKLFIVLLMLFNLIVPSKAMADHAGAAILVDGNTDEILFEKNSEEKKYPASTTKIMTLILIYEALNNGNLKLSDQITASSYASSMGGSQIYLKEGESMSVEELLKSILLASANDACVAFAEYLEGSVDLFVSKMNDKAKALKLKNTHFVNCTGLHDDDHYTCAYDLAMMAKYLLKIGGDHLLQYTTLKEDYIRNGEFWLVNTNKLLSQNDYITGLKTGYTKQSRYCLVNTALKDGQTLISVILEEEKAKTRNEEALQLINYGFTLFQSQTLFKANEMVCQIDLPLTKEKQIDLYTINDIIISTKKENAEEIEYQFDYFNMDQFKKGDHVANLVYQKQTFPLYANSDATPLSFIERWYEIFVSLLK